VARVRIAAQDDSTLLGVRDRTLLAVSPYHGLRRAEVCRLDLVDR
jgi:integrase